MRFPSALNPDPEVWKSGLRTAAAGGLAFICAEILALPQGYWAVMTAIVIMQASIGASLAAAADRFLGTLAGAALGLVFASVTPSTELGTIVALMLSTGMLGMLAARVPSFRIAPVTAAILLAAAPSRCGRLHLCAAPRRRDHARLRYRRRGRAHRGPLPSKLPPAYGGEPHARVACQAHHDRGGRTAR